MAGINFTAKRLRTANESKRETITLPLEQPLLIRLKRDVNRLPANIAIQLPRLEALALIRAGKATVVGDLAATPALVLDEDEAEIALRGVA